MPITKSAKKSLKVSRVKKAQNLKTKVSLSKALKNVDETNINHAISTIDKAAKTGVIHKNKAARLKSALSKKFSTVKDAVKKVVAKAETKVEKKTAVKKAAPSVDKQTAAKPKAKK